MELINDNYFPWPANTYQPENIALVVIAFRLLVICRFSDLKSINYLDFVVPKGILYNLIVVRIAHPDMQNVYVPSFMCISCRP